MNCLLLGNQLKQRKMDVFNNTYVCLLFTGCLHLIWSMLTLFTVLCDLKQYIIYFLFRIYLH